MKLPNWSLLAAALLSAMATPALFAAETITTVVIVRHGEKPDQGLGQLTCQGLNRSLALAPLLIKRYGAPAALYAPNPAVLKTDNGVPYPYIRPLATIEPLAIRLGLSVNIQWPMDSIQPLADRLLAAPAGVQVVAWEHHWGENLARQLVKSLGGDAAAVPKWKDHDFDSIYVVRISRNGAAPARAVFSHEQQGLDGLPTQCSDGPAHAQP